MSHIKIQQSIYNRRLVISLFVWVTSVVALYFSSLMAWKVVNHLLFKPHEMGNLWILALLFCFPWVALYKMNMAWLSDQKTSKFWPVAGTIFGIGGILGSFGVGVIFAPTAIIFACYLVYLHLR